MSPGLLWQERLGITWPANMFLFIEKAEIINAREVAPRLANTSMFNNSKDSEEGKPSYRSALMRNAYRSEAWGQHWYLCHPPIMMD